MAEGLEGEGYVLAVDLGTGGPKVALVNQRGQIAAHAKADTVLRLLPGGGAEQDPLSWWEAIVVATRQVLGSGAATAEQVVGIGCTSQWSGTVASAADGTPVRPALIWMDSRGATAMRRQMAGPVKVLGYDVRKLWRWVRLTGGAPGHSGKDPTAHILWMRDNEPSLYAGTHKFLEPVDWLNHKLTGRFVASFDSIAAHWVTDNRRVDAVEYDPTLMRMAGLDREKLPDLAPSATIIGHLSVAAAGDLGLAAGLPVATGTGDVHSAAVGSGAVADFEGHLYIGTSSWISCHVPYKKTDPVRNVASLPSALPGRYMVADEHETAGACLTFLAETVLSGNDALGSTAPADDIYARMDEVAAASTPGAHRTLFTPWLNGERSPVDDHTIRGGFHNLSLATTRGDLVRAVYEGVAYNSRWLLGAVEHFIGRPFPSLAFIGGGAKSDVWAQIHADVTGRPIRQVADPVLANVRGAGILTWLALGVVQVEDIPAMVDVRRTFEPDPALRPVYDELYGEFVNLYKRTKGIHKRLNATRSATRGANTQGASKT
ncbi:MAG TPA: FGGY-family carbohydrate kinase [Acidimicrobiales bacterium]|nr:FGGY-family carbohydrate kinase [Acidimicrobiales bacterium]